MVRIVKSKTIISMRVICELIPNVYLANLKQHPLVLIFKINREGSRETLIDRRLFVM